MLVSRHSKRSIVLRLEVCDQGSLSALVRDHSRIVTEAGVKNHFDNVISARNRRESPSKSDFWTTYNCGESLIELRPCKVILGLLKRRAARSYGKSLRNFVYDTITVSINRIDPLSFEGKRQSRGRAWGIRLACFASFHLAALVVAFAFRTSRCSPSDICLFFTFLYARNRTDDAATCT